MKTLINVYDKLVIPVIIILFIVLLYFGFFYPKDIIVSCSDGTEHKIKEYYEEWEELCEDVYTIPSLPSTPDPLTTKSLNLSTLSTTSNSIRR